MRKMNVTITVAFLTFSFLLASCSSQQNSASSSKNATNATMDIKPKANSSGSQCFVVEGDPNDGEVRVVIKNTPWGDKTAKVKFRTSFSDMERGGRTTASISSEGGNVQGVDYSYRADGSREKAHITVYVDKLEPRIKVIYDYSEGVESVTVDGKAVLGCSSQKDQ